jgi:alkylation response protein AidB-like acyl-CoA dehydrogenase
VTEERQLLRETVAALVDKHASPAAVREAMASERGYDESLWKLLCEQVGAAALVVPEELGGAGGELADAAVVLEELGKALVPTPLLGTTLAELALLAADTPDSDTLQVLADGTSIGTVVFDPGYVINGDVAKVAIAANGETLTRWTDFTAHRVDTMDLTRRLARLEPRDTADIGTDPGLADVAAILLAAEQIGAAAKCLDLTVEYTKDRVQFGRPIGSFQAVQQRMADGFIDSEAIRWTTWHAAWLISEGRPADRAARVAKFWAAEAGARIAATAQHVHGGIGIDLTYPLHRYFLMSKHNELTLGSATQQLVHLGSTYPEGRL